MKNDRTGRRPRRRSDRAGPAHPGRGLRTRGPGQAAYRLMPNSEYHEVLTEDRPDLDVALEEWSAKEGLLAAIFIDFLRRAERRS